MPGAWPCAFLRRSPRRCRFLRDRAQDLCAKRTALCRKRQPGVSGGRYMPEWPIAAGQAFWEACGLASTAKQRPPHGGDEPGIFRASGRYGCKLRHAGWAKAEKRLAIAKVPSAESTRHILTPTVSIDHSSTVYSPGRPRVQWPCRRHLSAGWLWGAPRYWQHFQAFREGAGAGWGWPGRRYRRSRLSASGRRAGWQALFTLPRMKWGAYGFGGDGRIWGIG